MLIQQSATGLPSLGSILGSSFTQSYRFNLTGLSPGQTYYFNVTSCIDWRCNSSGGYSFSTGIGDPTQSSVINISSNLDNKLI